MNVPLIDLKRFESGFLERWMEIVRKISQTANFIGGEEIQQLETNLARFSGTNFAISCANGTDAIQLSLRALGVGAGDTVLLPNLTFWATFEAIVNVGAKPITIDCDKTDGGIDYAALTEAFEIYKPKAAILVHLYGWSTKNLKEIRVQAKAKKVLLLEDGAQCFGTLFEGLSIYKKALISTTSFYPTKVLGAAGDGGAIFTNDERLAFKVRQLANHGRSDHYVHDAVGWNSRMDTLQAAYLNLTLEFLPRRINSRLNSLKVYEEGIKDIDIYQLRAPALFRENGYCQVCVITNLKLKQNLEIRLKSSEVGFSNIYPKTISSQNGAERFMHGHVGSNKAEEFCNSVLNLPLFPYMTFSELSLVIEVISKGANEFRNKSNYMRSN